MTYYDTTPQQVEDAMEATGIDNHRLIHALLERDHSIDEIKAMTPTKRLDEFLHWEGIIGWTGTILSVAKDAGFVVGEHKETGPENDEQMRDFLDGVVGAVDADSYAYHSLWEDFAEEALKFRPGCDRTRFSWDSRGGGLLTCVGTIGDLQCWISLRTAVVKGHKLLFYYGSGTFVHHGMIEAWLKKNLPETARFGPGGYNHTDATNFHNIFPREVAA